MIEVIKSPIPIEEKKQWTAFDAMESIKRKPLLINRNQTLMEHWNQTIAPW